MSEAETKDKAANDSSAAGVPVKSGMQPYDLAALVRVYTVSDLTHTDIRIMEPIMLLPNGQPEVDLARPRRYFSVATVTVGPPGMQQTFPVGFEIQGVENLRDAIEQAPLQAEKAAKDWVEKQQALATRQQILSGGAMPPGGRMQ